ncbi:MAG: hypothetical protein ACI81S_000462, partial [Sphingobacteriales bacterium]
ATIFDGCIPLNIDFTSSTIGPKKIFSYAWNFGNGDINNCFILKCGWMIYHRVLPNGNMILEMGFLNNFKSSKYL